MVYSSLIILPNSCVIRNEERNNIPDNLDKIWIYLRFGALGRSKSILFRKTFLMRLRRWFDRMKGGIYSLSGKTLVVCENKRLQNLVGRELREMGVEDVEFEVDMPEKIKSSVANVLYLAGKSELPFVEIMPETREEGFEVKKVDHEGRRYWVIISPSPRGRYYGFMKFLEGNDNVEDDPAFEVRGVVEGFYGPLWTWEGRASMVEFMSDLRMNTYIYAPKDDPLHREEWQSGYDQDDMDHFSSLIELSESHFVRFCFALSPGLSIDYSNVKDLQAIHDKLHQFHEIGVRDFAIFLDDIPDELQSDADKKRFASLGEAQCYFLTELLRMLKDLDPQIRLFFCPTKYHGVDVTEYHKEIAKLPGEIQIFWTGPRVCSQEIRTPDAEKMMKALGRKALIWDNYPVNDYDRKRRNVNAVRNRDPNLHEACIGMLSNPMSEAEASKVAIFTYGEYLWDPGHYDPDVSLERALTYVFGADVLPLAKVVVNNLDDFFFDCGGAGPTLDKIMEGDDIDLERGLVVFEEMGRVREILNLIENDKLLEELRTHIEKIADMGALGELRIEEERLARRIGRNPAKIRAFKG